MDRRFVQGIGRYLDDITPDGCLYVAFVRSPYAHARVHAVRCPESAAAHLVALVTGRELAPKLHPLRVEGPGLNAYDWYPLHPEKALFVGDAVAAVVARTRYEAEDLVDAIEVDYEPLPAVTSTGEAAEAKTAVHGQVPDNVLFRRVFNAGATSEAFSQADLVVERTFRHPRQTAVPMEGRGVLATYDAREGRFTVWSSTQIPHVIRTGIAEVLGVPEDRVRVIRPDVGGGFGLKSQLLPEEVVLPWLARELGAPVKWVEDRRENLMASIHAHEEQVGLAVALKRDGTLLAVRAETRVDVGAHSLYPISASLEPMTTSTSLFGAYRFEALEFEAIGFATNKAPVGGYRGVGLNAAVFATERILDIAADELGLDPAEIRLRNLLSAQEFPYKGPAGRIYDSGAYREALQLALRRIDYQRVREEQRVERRKGRWLGIGIATYNEHSGTGSRDYRTRGITVLPGYDGATVRISPDGNIYGLLSSSSTGQGHSRSYRSLIAEELGVSPERVHIIEGDTDQCPTGSGTFVSRSAVTMGSSLLLACRDLRAKLLMIAAHMVGAEQQELAIKDGAIYAAGDPSKSVTFQEVVRAAYLRTPYFTLPAGIEPGLEATRYYDPPQQVFSNSAHIALVEVDPETCELTIRRYVVVEDCGRVLDRDIVDGQILGGVAQGIGCALLEGLTYDESGQILTASLMDYLVPTATDVPPIELDHMETPSTVTLNGAKGVGESGVIGVGAALANAVADALGDRGAELTELPLTETRIFHLLHMEAPDGSAANRG